MQDKFQVWVMFSDGNHNLDKNWCSIEEVHSALQRLLYGPIAATGAIKEVRVVDSGDATVYLHQDGKQVWPANN